MKRSDFLKRLGIGIGAVMVAPKILAEEKVIYPRLKDGVTIDTDLLPIKKSSIDNLRHYPKTYEECYCYLGDTFVCNNEKYLCVSKIQDHDGWWKIVLRPFNSYMGNDITISAKDLSRFYTHTKESVLLKFND